SAAEAAAAAARLGYPVALKGLAKNVPHKSDLGLVRLGLADQAAVTEEWAALNAMLEKLRIVVQPMADDGIELIIAVRNDPQLGSFILVGPGGTLVELVSSVSVRRAPVNEATAEEMLDETVAGRLLSGLRGRGPFDRRAAASAIAALSR